MDVRKSVLVGHSAKEMFDVIEAAERYPEFLPWCAGATIVSRDEAEVVADIDVNFHGVRFGFRTRNPKRRPEWMAIHLERGPFRQFGGTWNLLPLGADGCRVDFDFSYHFDSTPMARLARPVFDRIVDTLVDRFVARADAVCPGHGTPVSASSTIGPGAAIGANPLPSITASAPDSALGPSSPAPANTDSASPNLDGRSATAPSPDAPSHYRSDPS